MRILVIDDNKDILDLTSEWIRAAGHDVIVADSAKGGLTHLKDSGIDVLLTDILMPDMDGIEIIKGLRKSHPDLWIVAISGGGNKLSANAALSMSQAFGADRTLYKPFRQKELLAAIQRE